MNESYPIRSLPYIALRENQRQKLRPQVEALKNVALSRLSGKPRDQFSLPDKNNVVLIISKPKEDHLGYLYKTTLDALGADLLIEEVSIDKSGEMIPDNYTALAIYPDGLALVRPNLDLTPRRRQRNREAREKDMKRFLDAVRNAVPKNNDSDYLL